MSGVDDIKRRVYDWNIKFPLDRWIRQKYKIPIFSKEHRNLCFVDMIFEFIEDDLYYNLEKNSNKPKYMAGTGNWLTLHEISKEDIDDAFDNLTLTD